jgi:hypothetical protein
MGLAVKFSAIALTQDAQGPGYNCQYYKQPTLFIKAFKKLNLPRLYLFIYT